MLKYVLSVISFAILMQNVQSSRILSMVMVPSYSHQMFYQQLWRELAIRGHEVVVVTTDPTNEVLPNFKEINIRESYAPAKELMNMWLNNSIFEMILQDQWNGMFINFSDYQLSLPQMQELINDKTQHFDLLMIEHFVSPALAIQNHFNCPMIGVVSMDARELSHGIMGNPVHSILYPLPLFPFQENLSFQERVVAMLFGNLFNYMQTSAMPQLDAVARKHFGAHIPPIMEIAERTDMLFVNANPVFSQIRPYTPSTISIAGGMHIKPQKPLPKELKDFLDSAQGGAIYFSLGSNVRSNELTLELRQTVMDTLAQLPYKILWKFEEDTLPGKPDNIMITKWAPQQDVLRHKNVKLFITQGGLQSLEETLYSHVPIVIMPFSGDQMANAQKAKNKGIGLMVDRYNLTIDEFKRSILEVLRNPIYRETVIRLANVIQDTPMTTLERAVWWTEYVLRHKGAQHLKGPRIPLYQYYYLDVLAFLGVVCLAIFGLLYVLIRFVIKGVYYLFKNKETKCARKEKFKTK